MRVVNRLFAILAFDVVRDAVHRPRPIQRIHCNDVFKAIGLELAQTVAHTGTFQLEDAGGIALGDQRVGCGVIQRQIGQIDLHAAAVQQLDTLLQHIERLQTEKVEFDQPRQFDPFHVELRHRHVGARVAVERHQLR